MFPISRNNKLSKEDYFPYLCSPKDLEDSYARCRLAGVPVELSKPKVTLPQAKLISRLAANTQLLIVIDQLITSICCSGPQKKHLFILCDPELVVLKIYADQDTVEAAEKAGFGSETVFTEESCGTNALSLAREHGGFVAIRAKQHYATLFENWWCVAGPIKDTEGKVIGYQLSHQQISFKCSRLWQDRHLNNKYMHLLVKEIYLQWVHVVIVKLTLNKRKLS